MGSEHGGEKGTSHTTSAPESVWHYPRPPRAEPTSKLIEVFFNGVCIAHTNRAIRVLETSHPPVYYIPPEDILPGCLIPIRPTSYCEWKGQAHYFNVKVEDAVAEVAAWSYPNPQPGCINIRDYVAFYPQKMEACKVDGETVKPQPGGYYGGWITSGITGPYKGNPGTQGW